MQYMKGMFFGLATALAFSLCTAHDASNCKYVTIPVCGEGAISTELLSEENSARVRAVGPPGKSGARGPLGPKGSRGDVGPKGEHGAPANMELVADMVREKLAAFERNAASKTATDFCRAVNQSGIYSFHGDLFNCDGKGWTVIQHRRDGSIDFERTWAEYRQGFGSLDGEFWIGLTTIHKLTYNRNCEIRFDFVSFERETAYAEYSSFNVADEGRKFQLSISGYSGTAGDSMTFHDGMFFSTKDKDNDQFPSNCAGKLGGWWFKNCFRASPNGVWGRSSGPWTKIIWYTWKGDSVALDSTTIKIRCT